MSVVEGGVDVAEEVVPGWGDIVRSRQGGGKGTNLMLKTVFGCLCTNAGPDVEFLAYGCVRFVLDKGELRIHPIKSKKAAHCA